MEKLKKSQAKFQVNPLAKVDDKPINGRTMSLKEAKQWLLDSIDKTIAVAKTKQWKDNLISLIKGVLFGKRKRRIREGKTKSITSPLTFPNDGKFKSINTIESLKI